MIILASLPGKNSRLKALRQFSRRSLRCGVMVPEKISKSPLTKPRRLVIGETIGKDLKI
jgi:hypothetical protein